MRGLVIVADNDKSIRARIIRLRWRIESFVHRGPRRWISVTICTFAGCRWHEVPARVENQQHRDYETLSTCNVIAVHRTCSRCWRNVLTYHMQPKDEPCVP